MSTTLRARFRTQLPAVLQNGVGIAVTKLGLIYQIATDWSDLGILGNYNPSAQQLIAQNTVDGSFGLITITQVLTASQTQQIKISAGNVTVAVADGLIIVNKTVGAATTVTLPLAASKVGPVKVVDWKGDAAANNITINVTGSDKLNGGLTSSVIASNRGSLVFSPISDGSGYAV